MAGVFKKPGLLEDYVERGLEIMNGFTASTILNHLVELKKLCSWRNKIAQWDEENIKSISYDVDIFSTIADLEVIIIILSSN